MRKIRDGVRWYQQEVFSSQRAQFRVRERARVPQIMFLSCSDAPVDPSQLTQASTGDLYVIQNAGNFVADGGSADGLAAAIEYGVGVLGVDHIILCGHSHCGAVAAALDSQTLTAFPAMKAWFDRAAPNFHDFEPDSPDRLLSAVRHNVRVQLEALRVIPCVAQALGQGRVQLHGWVHRFEDGVVEELDSTTNRFASLSETSGPWPHSVASMAEG
jgi:carbonic anhydrase